MREAYKSLVNQLKPGAPDALNKILKTRRFYFDDVLTGQGASGSIEVEFTNQGTGLDWKGGVPVSVVYKPGVTVYLNLEGRMSGKITVAPYISNESITYGSPEEAVKQFHLILHNAIDAASDHLRVFSSEMDWLADDMLDSAKDHWFVLRDWGLVQFGDKKK